MCIPHQSEQYVHINSMYTYHVYIPLLYYTTAVSAGSIAGGTVGALFGMMLVILIVVAVIFTVILTKRKHSSGGK